VPNPSASVRAKVSAARNPAAAGSKVAVWVVVPVAPALSVTVSVTVNVPGLVYVWVVALGVALVCTGEPSPKSIL